MLTVRFKVLEPNPQYNPENANTVAPYFEKTQEGTIQGYIIEKTGDMGRFSDTPSAIVLIENKLKTVPLRDLTVIK